MCVFADFLAASPVILRVFESTAICVRAFTRTRVMMCVSSGLSRMSAPAHHCDSFEPLACGE